MLGVFDSGVGGLSSVKELAKCLPEEALVYFGDTGRVPYGTRSEETIIRYAMQDARFLMEFSPKAILVACGTVSSVALDALQNAFDVPIIGVVAPTAAAAAVATKNRKIAVLGTPATIRSGAYGKQLLQLDPGLEIFSMACPLFVPLVENGHIDPDDPITAAAVAHYLEPVAAFGADTIILGCTHYPLLKQIIGQYVGQQVRLIDAGRESALALKRILTDSGLRSDEGGGQRFFVSDAPADFADTARIFLQKDIREAVKRIDIEKY